ncbi:conserved hypothetical protein, HNE_0200 family [Arenibacter nanhaiticus]|uniref:Cytochrome c domain-containing protein n=1 Tax=Arenibacter nanhaiticus TaxID=558155 RepID=A0A1M6C5W0_9FLAO|nr:hypothetical protein [Arenibacter nanhaiticus]SHI56352.1 conserved hypothetical protein, HNE_0200 family [Arenibacter nanhaiticus]
MKISKILLLAVPIISITVLLLSLNRFSTFKNEIKFSPTLSSYGFFQGKMSNLIPSPNVEVFELSAPLFSDYAEKQRLFKIPKDSTITILKTGKLDFPEGSILAKTFFYRIDDEVNALKILETRLLIKKDSRWNFATYQWNEPQTEAFLTLEGADSQINWMDNNNKYRQINYHIPSPNECIACHKSNGKIQPIGPKVGNLKKWFINQGDTIDQWQHFIDKKLIVSNNLHDGIEKLPDYNDVQKDLTKRARAYLDINCAHCHNPLGIANYKTLNLGYEVPYEKTGIALKYPKIIHRMKITGDLHMPKLGTTILHDEGYDLIKEYVQQLHRNKPMR